MKIIYFCCPKSTLMRVILLSVVCLYLAACGGTTKKDKILSTTNFTDNEFTKEFPVLNLKYQVSDSMLKNNAAEKPLAVAGKNYFPDSLVTAFFGKNVKPKFYPLGKTMNPGREVYLVMHGSDGERHAAFLLCYDNQLNYKDGLLLCATDNDPKSYSSGSIDKSFGIVTRKENYQSGEGLKVSERTLMFSEGAFIDILNNDPEQKQTMVNPLDTMSAKGKFAGDYVSGEQNFISIRDGRDSGEIVLFYHFEKGEGCNKEIKDYARINSKNTAIFRKDGDPCVFTLTFTGTQLTLKEDQGCGNYRGLNCTLNGTFTKKKKPGAASDTLKKKVVAPVKKTK